MAASIAFLPRAKVRRWLDRLSPNAQAALPYLFDLWGMEGHQLPPEGDWLTWLILGGRGAGKTRAGAEWIRTEVEGATPLGAGRRRRVALVAETADEAVEVMIRGESGLIACSPKDRRPVWVSGRRTLVWPNGAEAAVFSAHNPDGLRGPQFDCAWSDELGKWPNPQEAWDMLQFSLRLGDRPRQVVTTTPRANPVIEALLKDKTVAVGRAPTRANRANLAASFLRQVESKYGGTARGRQELEGELVLEAPGALWTRAGIEAARVRSGPEMQRVVVAIDPPVTAGPKADECGIVVAGLGSDGRGYVMADRSSHGETPQGWAERAVAAYREFAADRIVAEANQGGDLVELVLREVDRAVPYRKVHARHAKRVRAEPVSALYEQGRVRHLGGFPQLEDQMCGFGAGGSPDRVDALVWALTELMLGAAPSAPQVRLIE